MTSSIAHRLARDLKSANVRIETDADGYVVVVAGRGEPYRSSPLTVREAETVKRFLRGLRDHQRYDLKGDFEEIVETCRRRYPNVSAEAIRKIVGRALEENWHEATLAEELTRESYARVLQNYEVAGLWGILVMTQRDGNVCAACQQFDNVAYHIDRAIDEEPLSHPGCANRTCRCRYLPVFREADLYTEIERRR